MKTTVMVSLAVLAMAASPLAAQSGLYFSEDKNANGLYAFDATTGAATKLGASGVTGFSVGLAPTASVFDLYGSSPADLNRIKTDGSGAGMLGSANNCEGMAYHRSADLLYASIGGAFFTLDTSVGGVVTKLSVPKDIDLEGLAYDINRGIVWALPGANDRNTMLWYYTPETGRWATWMDTAIDWNHPGLAYDPHTDLLYAKDTVTSALLAIDPIAMNFYKVGDTTLNTGGGLALIPEAITLESDSYLPQPGAKVALTMYDGLPATPGLLAVVDVSGTPTFQVLGLRPFDGSGQAVFGGIVPAGLSGLDASLLGMGFTSPNVIGLTNTLTLQFQ